MTLRAAPADAGPAANAAVFVTGLQDEKGALAAFIQLLQTEQEALVQGDADRLAELGREKSALIELLGYLGEARNRFLASHNLNANAEGMLTWLKRNQGFAAAVGKLWRELLAQAETAQRINQNNGALIASRMQHNRLKLAVLQNAAAADGVYRPDGQLRPTYGARSFSQV